MIVGYITVSESKEQVVFLTEHMAVSRFDEKSLDFEPESKKHSMYILPVLINSIRLFGPTFLSTCIHSASQIYRYIP